MDTNFTKQYLLPILKTWKEDKIREGLIPTVDLLIEELEEQEKEGELVQEAQRLTSERD